MQNTILKKHDISTEVEKLNELSRSKTSETLSILCTLQNAAAFLWLLQKIQKILLRLSFNISLCEMPPHIDAARSIFV